MSSLGLAQIERLVRYYHCSRVREDDSLMSGQLARCVGVDSSLVRKDLAAIGVRGHPRAGYQRSLLQAGIQQALAFTQPKRVVIVGVGRLGSALAAHKDFHAYGLEVVGLLDRDPARIGARLGRLRVRPVAEMEAVVRTRKADLIIIATPREAAQAVAEQAVRAGIRLIWLFTPVCLNLPPHVFVRHEPLAVGLSVLSWQLARRRNRQAAE